MKTLVCLPTIFAALWLGSPSTGLSKDHDHGHDHGHDRGNWSGGHGDSHGGNWHGSNNWHGSSNWHGHNYHGSHVRYYGYGSSYPFYSYYPYYSAPYYDDSYYASPSIGFSITTAPTYRGAAVSDRGDGLAVDVQRALRRDGYYRGSIDGDIGVGTRAAIRQYQYDHRLEVTGRIDRSLLRSLALD